MDPKDGTADYDVNPNWEAEQISRDEDDWAEHFHEPIPDMIKQQLEIATGVFENILNHIKLQYRVVDMDLDRFTGTGKTSPTYDARYLAEEMQEARGGCVEVRYVTEWQEVEQ